MFKAPTEDLEKQIVEFCMNELGFELGEFWYSWFTSRNTENASLHIDCNIKGLSEVISYKLAKQNFIDKIFKIQECPMHDEEFEIKYHIHFKTQPWILSPN